jgi:IS1 family transposase
VNTKRIAELRLLITYDVHDDRWETYGYEAREALPEALDAIESERKETQRLRAENLRLREVLVKCERASDKRDLEVVNALARKILEDEA